MLSNILFTLHSWIIWNIEDWQLVTQDHVVTRYQWDVVLETVLLAVLFVWAVVKITRKVEAVK